MADLKLAYATAVEIDIDPESLASSAARTAGVESASVDNTSNKYLDALVGGKIKTGTSPTVGKQIDVWVYADWDGASGFPDVLDGTKSAETIASENVRNSALRLLASIRVDATSDRIYYLAPTSVAALFGGVMPRKWGLFLAHDTAVNLNSTAGDHAFHYVGVYMTST